MRDYELMIILHPELDNEAIVATLDQLKAKLSSLGELTACDLLGRRRLAYTVRKCHQGVYALLNFSVPPAAVTEIQRFLKVELHEQVIRELLILDEKRGTRPPAQPLPGEEAASGEDDEQSEEERLAQLAAERAAAEEAARQEPGDAPAEAPAEAAVEGEED